jgi:hypothetical protein
MPNIGVGSRVSPIQEIPAKPGLSTQNRSVGGSIPLWESKLLCCSSDRLFQDWRAAASGFVTVQRLAIDKGTFEWYKRRISGGIKSLFLLCLLSADDSPPLGTIGSSGPVLSRPSGFADQQERS